MKVKREGGGEGWRGSEGDSTGVATGDGGSECQSDPAGGDGEVGAEAATCRCPQTLTQKHLQQCT